MTPFDYVGDVFTLVNRSFDDFEDFFPLDDLDRGLFLVEKLGDQRTAQAVAIIFVAVDFDACSRLLVPFQAPRPKLSTRDRTRRDRLFDARYRARASARTRRRKV